MQGDWVMADIDLTASGSSADIGSGIEFTWVAGAGAGTGTLGTFLTLHNTPTETGFNTDQNNVLDNGPHTFAVQFSTLAVVNSGGADYYEFHLDLNETNSGTNPLIQLEEMKFYYSAAAATSTDYTGTGLGAGFIQVFDLNSNGDSSLLLADHSTGSGRDDYTFLVPTALFTDKSGYMTLYAQFDNSNGGFEEFSVLSNLLNGPSLGIVKDTLVGTASVAGGDVLVGTNLTWTYDVTNNGNVSLDAAPTVTDNQNVTVTQVLVGGFNAGDTNQNHIFDAGETWLYSGTGTATAGAYSNIGEAKDTYGTTNLDQTASSSYFGADPEISIAKDTLKAGTATSVAGASVLVGTGLTWTYTVTNTGNVSLAAPAVTDNQGVTVTAVTDLTHTTNSGDTNNNGVFDVGEVWRYTASGAATAGQYNNIGDAKDSFTDSAGQVASLDQTSPSSYFGATPGISIDKQVSIDGGAHWLDVTNGNLADITSIALGANVEFRVIVTNTSTGTLTETGISVTDAADTPYINGVNFKFGGQTTIATLAAGASVTSDALITPALGGLHSDTATVTGTAADAFGDTAAVTDHDSANYTGVFIEGVNGLSIGYWYNHHTVSEVTGAHFVSGAWHEAFGTTAGGTTYEGILLGDTTGAAWQAHTTAGTALTSAQLVAAGMLLIPDAAAAQLINASQSANDTRQTLLSQALGAQLNIDNGDANPGGSTAGNLIGEAVQWLEGKSPYGAGGKIDTNGDGVLSTSGTIEFNTSTHAFTSTALTSSQAAWQSYVSYSAADYHPVGNTSVFGSGAAFSADGEGLKNALQAFDTNHMVTNAGGTGVAWNQSGSAIGPYTDLTLNFSNDFWSILHTEVHLTNSSLLHGIA
jgi:hypothetical protein